MRIQTFQIERFGCFAKQLLDFSDRSQDLHIIYGPNEAGKSTALRAIVNMLYGIPAQTQDGFLYSYEDMRLTACLENLSGDVATFIRRKGNRATLLDSNQQLVDEGVLAAYLCGIQQNAFTTMFGFDYHTLLEGRRDLKEGKGDLAESLFQAGMGITGLRGILEELQKEKEVIFSPRATAKNPSINAAMKRYKESMKSVSDLSVRPREWQKLAEEINRIEDEFAKTKAEYESCVAKKARYERYQKAFPLASQRGAAIQCLSELLAKHILTELQIEQYQRDNEKRLDAVAEQDRLVEREREIRNRWPDSTLIDRLATHRDDVISIQGRLKQYEAAQDDLPKVAKDQNKYESRAKELIQECGAENLIKNSGFTCIDSSERAVIATFLKQHFGVEEPVQTIMLHPTNGCAGLKLLAEAASSEGKIEQSASRARTKIVELKAQAQTALSSLTLWSGKLEHVVALPVPLDETISRFSREFSEIESAVRDIERDIDSTEKNRAQCQEKISAFIQAQTVPSENDLIEDRQRREYGWQLIRRAWLDSEDVSEDSGDFDLDHPLDQAYELSVGKADETSDRLRREAERVASLAELRAASARADEELGQLRGDLLELQTRRKKKTADWAAQWKPVGIDEPLTPAEMQEWLQRHRNLAGICSDIGEKETELSDMEQVIKNHKVLLKNELSGMEFSNAPEDVTLQDLIARAKEVIDTVTILKDLGSEIRQADECRSRVELMQTSISEFESDVAKLITNTQMTELVSIDAGEAARTLQDKVQQAAEDKARLSLLESQLTAAKAIQDESEKALAALADETSCENLDLLSIAAKDSRDYYELDSKRKELDEKLTVYSSGASVEAFVQELSDVSEDELAGLIAGLVKKMEDLDCRRDELSNERGEKSTALANLDRSDDLATEVQNAQSALAVAKSAVERYVSLHLATEILSMEIERYQRENQDPVLTRASEVFPILTLNSFQRVDTQHTTKGNQVIVGVRPSGTTVDVSGMSDGTRDQLYMSLRIASLEQHIKNGVVLPLILDDILIEFDDERAGAALNTLAQLSEKTQVLYFTHHKHIVDLANEVLGSSCMHLQQLIPNSNARD
ncbi:MAG: AAA family ATPase [Armatimonadota bacterium]|nr:AAA family ATPase [bacterium]